MKIFISYRLLRLYTQVYNLVKGDDMDEENDNRGPDGDMGSYVEDARGYDPEESEDGIIDKVKNVLGGDSDNPDDDESMI